MISTVWQQHFYAPGAMDAMTRGVLAALAERAQRRQKNVLVLDMLLRVYPMPDYSREPCDLFVIFRED